MDIFSIDFQFYSSVLFDYASFKYFQLLLKTTRDLQNSKKTKTLGLFLTPRTQSNSSHRYSPIRQSVWHPSKLSHTSRHRSSFLKNVMNLRSMSWDSKTARRCKQVQTVRAGAEGGAAHQSANSTACRWTLGRPMCSRGPGRKCKDENWLSGLLTWVCLRWLPA